MKWTKGTRTNRHCFQNSFYCHHEKCKLIGRKTPKSYKRARWFRNGAHWNRQYHKNNVYLEFSITCMLMSCRYIGFYSMPFHDSKYFTDNKEYWSCALIWLKRNFLNVNTNVKYYTTAKVVLCLKPPCNGRASHGGRI